MCIRDSILLVTFTKALNHWTFLHLTGKVYSTKPATINELNEAIETDCTQTLNEMNNYGFGVRVLFCGGCYYMFLL